MASVYQYPGGILTASWPLREEVGFFRNKRDVRRPTTSKRQKETFRLCSDKTITKLSPHLLEQKRAPLEERAQKLNALISYALQMNQIFPEEREHRETAETYSRELRSINHQLSLLK